MLAKLLRDEPSEEVIDAVSSIADEECMVQLGRIARTEPALSDAALNALEDIDQPRANAIAAKIRDVDAMAFPLGRVPGRSIQPQE
jgi:hypothetical protein